MFDVKACFFVGFDEESMLNIKLEKAVLLEFGIRNFCSFREGATVSLRLDSSCPEAISHGRSFATVFGVKGANAAGKTHLLKAIAFVTHFCTRSFFNEPNDPIPFSSFFDNSDPTEIYVDFEVDDVGYRYEVEMTDEEVMRETVWRTKARRKKIIERIGLEVVNPSREFESFSKIKLRSNASIISIAHQYELEVLAPLYRFFSRFSSNVGFSGLKDRFLQMEETAKFLHGQPDILKFVKDFVKGCDVGVSDISILQQERESVEGKKVPAAQKYEYLTFFHHEVDGEEKFIPASVESSGTRTLFRTVTLYKLALDIGSVVVLDEFDLHLHPHLLPKIFDLFDSPISNPKGAQLIVSTHDDRILDLLGRYRTVLVNKDQNESYAFRLDEVPGDIVRNDRSMLSAYNDGKIGGVPRL